MFKEIIQSAERLAANALLRSGLSQYVPIGRASIRVEHLRPTGFIKDSSGLLVPDPRSLKLVDEPEVAWNLITNSGRLFLHQQGYATTGLAANGLNFIALSNNTVTETAASTSLSGEIVASGLARAAGTVTLPTGAGNQTTVVKTFTATGSVSAQKAALFNAASGGTMNHVIGFTQRNLLTNDNLQITFTITLG